MQYGPSIPPKTFLNTSPQFFTKQGFAHYLARALQTVGMIPHTSINTCDLADPANAERDPGSSEDAQYWWDYPTTETFQLGGVSYRPVLGMSNSVYRTFYTPSNYSVQGRTVSYPVGQNVGFLPFRRRADRLLKSDFQCTNGLHRSYTGNFGFGASSQDTPGYFAENGGSVTGFYDWKLFAAWANVQMQTLLFVNRVFVHLSPAGLIVQVGTHPTRRDETGNLINFMVAFHGGRIPSRGLAPIDDVLRDRVDPTAWFDLGGYADGIYANSGRGEMFTTLLGSSKVFNGAQSDVTYPTYAFMRSIDYNDDAPLNNAPLDNYPRPSPTVRNGVGVHLLHRACLLMDNTLNNNGYSGRVDSVKQPNLIGLAAWSDAFYLPGIALCDRVVPPGPRQDPQTLKNWYLIWATPRQQAFAIDYTGVVTVATPTAGAEVLTLMNTHALAITGVAAFDPPYTRNVVRNTAAEAVGHARTLLGTFGGVSVYVYQIEHSNVDVLVANRWKKTAAYNGFQLDTYGWQGSYDGTKYMQLMFEFEGLSTDIRDSYTFESEIRLRSSNDPSNTDPAAQIYRYGTVQIASGRMSDVLTTETLLVNLRLGSNAFQNAYWNYLLYGSWPTPVPPTAPVEGSTMTRITPSTAGYGTAYISLVHNYGDPNPIYAPSVDVQNIVLKQYRRS